MNYKRLRRLAQARHGRRFSITSPNRSILQDLAAEHLGFNQLGGTNMWAPFITEDGTEIGVKVGMVICQETFTFPFIGTVMHFDDTRIVLKDAVRVLYDGRHNEYAAGADRIPASAEIEKTHSYLVIPADFCGPWAPYAGGRIPRGQ